MRCFTEKTMSKMTINIENTKPDCRVRDIRRQLAQVLSRLAGDREATFNLTVRLGDHSGKS